MHSKQTILVTGASGLIGTALRKQLKTAGYSARNLSRSGDGPIWDLQQGTISEGALENVDTVVHLAGAPIAQR